MYVCISIYYIYHDVISSLDSLLSAYYVTSYFVTQLPTLRYIHMYIIYVAHIRVHVYVSHTYGGHLTATCTSFNFIF